MLNGARGARGGCGGGVVGVVGAYIGWWVGGDVVSGASNLRQGQIHHFGGDEDVYGS